MPPGLRITAIIATYNEADIIAQTVGDLVHQGTAVHVLDVKQSWSWRLTAPLRAVWRLLR